jgi:hypothetical protein
MQEAGNLSLNEGGGGERVKGSGGEETIGWALALEGRRKELETESGARIPERGEGVEISGGRELEVKTGRQILKRRGERAQD